jgi:hypothetical protein
MFIHDSTFSSTVGLCVLPVTMLLAPVSQLYKVMFIIPHVALDSSMACRVFRGLRLGLIGDFECCSKQPNPSDEVRFIRTPGIISDGREHDPPVSDIRLEIYSEPKSSFPERVSQGVEVRGFAGPPQWA